MKQTLSLGIEKRTLQFSLKGILENLVAKKIKKLDVFNKEGLFYIYDLLFNP